MIDESLVTSSTILWYFMPLRLIMKRWIQIQEKLYFWVKEQLKLLQSDKLTQKRPMLIICDSNRVIFLLFSPSPSWHKCSLVHCGCRAQLFTQWRRFYRLIPSNGPAKGSIWQTTEHYLQSCWLSPHSHRLSSCSLPPHTQLSLCGCWYGAALLIAAH